MQDRDYYICSRQSGSSETASSSIRKLALRTQESSKRKKKLTVKTPRSRGCRICVERRIKCDRARPSCQNCVRAKRECPGLSTINIVDEGPNLRAAYNVLEPEPFENQHLFHQHHHLLLQSKIIPPAISSGLRRSYLNREKPRMCTAVTMPGIPKRQSGQPQLRYQLRRSSKINCSPTSSIQYVGHTSQLFRRMALGLPKWLGSRSVQAHSQKPCERSPCLTPVARPRTTPGSRIPEACTARRYTI